MVRGGSDWVGSAAIPPRHAISVCRAEQLTFHTKEACGSVIRRSGRHSVCRSGRIRAPGIHTTALHAFPLVVEGARTEELALLVV
eukprot:3104870-Alexandrium_andersonii.AAC.1